MNASRRSHATLTPTEYLGAAEELAVSPELDTQNS